MSEEDDTKHWVYAGGIPFELTEGDIVCVFSQFGEITEMTLSRDRETGRSRGFGFIKYEDPRSCEMAVDNFNGATIVGRKIKVSFANNSQALRNRKPAMIAPQEGSTLPIVENRKRRVSNSPSPQPQSRARRSRSPVDNYRDDYDRGRNRPNYRAIEYNKDSEDRRRSPNERPAYRNFDNYDRRDRNRDNYEHRDRNPDNYKDHRDRREGGDLRYKDRESDRGHLKDSSTSHRRRDSRDRSDQNRSRYRREDDNIDRSHGRNFRDPDYTHNSRDIYRRSDRRSRSIERSPPPPRSPERRHYHNDDGDRHQQHHQQYQAEKRYRPRHDSRDRKAYN